MYAVCVALCAVLQLGWCPQGWRQMERRPFAGSQWSRHATPAIELGEASVISVSICMCVHRILERFLSYSWAIRKCSALCCCCANVECRGLSPLIFWGQNSSKNKSEVRTACQDPPNKKRKYQTTQIDCYHNSWLPRLNSSLQSTWAASTEPAVGPIRSLPMFSGPYFVRLTQPVFSCIFWDCLYISQLIGNSNML